MNELMKCLGTPSVAMYFISLALFVAAYVTYRIFLTAFRRIFRKDGVWKRLIEAVRFPILFILYEIVALISLNFLGIKEYFEPTISHLFLIFMIGTIGWLVAKICRALFHHFMEKYENVPDIGKEERTLVTQILFLYRFVMFAVVTITLASILMTFPHIKSVGIGILSSAGIAGIALGVAARPILLNIMAGFQIAMTKTINIGDAVIVEKDFARIEAIHLTHVIARTWDLRRIVLPISHFIDQPFQNWDTTDPELLGSAFIYCDYSAPIEAIRKKVEEVVHSHSKWNKKVCKTDLTNCTDKTIELRIVMTANDAGSAFELRCHVREKIIDFLQKEHPYALPCFRFRSLPDE